MSPRFPMPVDAIDLQEIARRIIKLAEISTKEHLEMLMNSQAEEMLKLAREADAA